MDFDQQKAIILDLFDDLMEGLGGDGIRNPSIDVDLGAGEARVTWTPEQPGADEFNDAFRRTADHVYRFILGEEPTDLELESLAAEIRAGLKGIL